ncbi:MAG: DUF308 domain-containing protein [Bacilli bacterium]|nr:DUF308 domain-containing protein [Bacilli bacterium]
MSIKKKQISIISNLISGLGIIILGIIVTIGSINMYTKTINLFVYIFIIYGLSKLVNFLLNRKIVRNKQTLLGIVINIVLGIVMLLFPKVSLSILPIIFSMYLLLNAVVKFITYINLRELNLKLRFSYLFFSIFFLSFSLLFLFYPLEELSLFLTIISCYCIILGLNKIIEFIIDLLTDKYKLKIKRRLRITLPVFLEAFVPQRGLKEINKYIEYLTYEEKNYKEDTELKIFIHLSKYGFNQFGHIDIMFDDKIYSYGNYDKASERFFTMLGDGVLFNLKTKDKYIKFCINNSKKTIVEYGVRLSSNQKAKLKRELDNIMLDCYEWKPPVKLDKENEHKDYASKLYKATRAKFYKFKSSKYKIYFVLGINCTYFADMLLRNSVFEVLKLVGIISPGTYFEYLEELYRKKNSNVISKRIYNEENFGDVCVEDKK